MDSLIPVINKLQDVFPYVQQEGIDLPQIVVVGNQVRQIGLGSSDHDHRISLRQLKFSILMRESSVIESIVGRDFLPRGTGIVTRCPLVLQLINIKESPKEGWFSFDRSALSSRGKEHAEFLHRKDEPFYDFTKIRKEIELQTAKQTGGLTKKKISPNPITLKIFSNKVVNLTLIDLPGMTKVPVGDQPPDIEKQVRDLIESYIQNPNSIILAVIAANTDLATSDALQLAKLHDPDGKRTLAVLTKLDLMDRGTNAVEVLTGRVIPVKLGIIGVMNRAQQDIVNNKSIEDALQDEAAYLEKHYADLASSNGSRYLVKRLNTILLGHIRKCLPYLRNRVNTLASQYRSELDSYGENMDDQGCILLEMIRKFTEFYRSTIDGTENIQTAELCGGARICQIFQETFSGELNAIDCLHGLTDNEIRRAIKNSAGLMPALNVPTKAFEQLVKRQLKQLEAPSLRCVEWVHEELLNILEHCRSNMDQHLPELLEAMAGVVRELIAERLPATNEMVANLLASELAHINVNHENFQNPYGNLVSQPATSVAEAAGFFSRPAAAPSNQINQLIQALRLPDLDLAALNLSDSEESKEVVHCEIMKALIKSYFAIVQSQVRDLVPKITVCFLVNRVKDNVHFELVRQLYREDRFDSLVCESEYISEKRKEAADMLDALESALRTINEISEHKL